MNKIVVRRSTTSIDLQRPRRSVHGSLLLIATKKRFRGEERRRAAAAESLYILRFDISAQWAESALRSLSLDGERPQSWTRVFALRAGRGPCRDTATGFTVGAPDTKLLPLVPKERRKKNRRKRRIRKRGRRRRRWRRKRKRKRVTHIHVYREKEREMAFFSLLPFS